MAALSTARVFEVDHPDTQRAKRARARDLGSADRVIYVPVDFERDALDRELLRAKFDVATPTMTIWEGVTPYLTPEAIKGTLATLRPLLANGSELAVTYGWKILGGGRGCCLRISVRRVQRTTLRRSRRDSHFCQIRTTW